MNVVQILVCQKGCQLKIHLQPKQQTTILPPDVSCIKKHWSLDGQIWRGIALSQICITNMNILYQPQWETKPKPFLSFPYLSASCPKLIDVFIYFLHYSSSLLWKDQLFTNCSQKDSDVGSNTKDSLKLFFFFSDIAKVP